VGFCFEEDELENAETNVSIQLNAWGGQEPGGGGGRLCVLCWSSPGREWAVGCTYVQQLYKYHSGGGERLVGGRGPKPLSASLLRYLQTLDWHKVQVYLGLNPEVRGALQPRHVDGVSKPRWETDNFAETQQVHALGSILCEKMKVKGGVERDKVGVVVGGWGGTLPWLISLSFSEMLLKIPSLAVV